MRERMSFGRVTSAFLVAAGALLACDGPPPLYGGRGSASGPAVPAPDMARPAYPPGPYGNQEGDTLGDFAASGYRLSPAARDSTQLPWETIRLSDFHAHPSCRCLLITVGAIWCPACREEQPALIEDIERDPAFCVLGVLQEGARQDVTATREDVDDWTQEFLQNFPVVQGNATTGRLWRGWDQGGVIGLPFSLIVRPEDMRVVGGMQGFSPDIHDRAVELCGG